MSAAIASGAWLDDDGAGPGTIASVAVGAS